MDQKKSVLIIEDEKGLRDALEDIISTAGYDVKTAINGVEGLAVAKSSNPDVILLDLRMPLMNGFEMFSSLRADEAGKEMKVIILSAVDDEASRKMAAEFNPEHFLVKTDVSLQEIADTVARVVG